MAREHMGPQQWYGLASTCIDPWTCDERWVFRKFDWRGGRERNRVVLLSSTRWKPASVHPDLHLLYSFAEPSDWMVGHADLMWDTERYPQYSIDRSVRISWRAQVGLHLLDWLISASFRPSQSYNHIHSFWNPSDLWRASSDTRTRIHRRVFNVCICRPSLTLGVSKKSRFRTYLRYLANSSRMSNTIALLLHCIQEDCRTRVILT